MSPRAFLLASLLASAFPNYAAAAPLWDLVWDGGDSEAAHGLALDASGAVYTSGNSGSNINIVRLSSAGVILSTWTYDSGNLDAAWGFSLDAAGNVYAAGQTFNGSNLDFRFVKFTSTGGVALTGSYDGGGTDLAWGAGSAADGSIIVGGTSGSDWRLIKYASTGAVVWSRSYDSGLNDGMGALAVDASGYAYAVGHHGDANDDIKTIKFDPSGNIVWLSTYTTGQSERARGVTIDASGNVYVVGYSGPDFLLLKYSPSGTLAWSRTWGSGGDFGYAVAVDAGGRVFAAGSSAGASANDFRLWRYDADGTLVSTTLYADGSVNSEARGVAVDGSGGVYLSGLGNGADYRVLKDAYAFIASAPFSGVFGTSLTVNWASNYPAGTQYTAQLSSVSDFSGTVASSATLNLSATFTGLALYATYYARVATAPAGPFTVLGSTRTPLFSVRTQLGSGLISFGVAWGDYDKDGDLDAFVANSANMDALILRNDGAGTLTQVVITSSARNAGAVAWADADGDGDLDALLATNSDNSGAVLLRNDAGTWAPVTIPGTAGSGVAVAWGDYDNDGDPDALLAQATPADADEILLRNDGGVLSAVTIEGTGGNTKAIAWGDYDNDGDLDAILANDSGDEVLLRNDGGTLTPVTLSGTAGSSADVAWGDFDGDGRLDAVVANGWFDDIALLRNTGGAFVKTLIPGTSSSYAVAVGDYDADGDADILVAGSGTNSREYLLRNDGGVFAKILLTETGDASVDAAWADYDGDGDLDALVANWDQGTDEVLLLNDAAPYNAPPSAPAVDTVTLDLAPGGGTMTVKWAAGAYDGASATASLSYALVMASAPMTLSPDGLRVTSPGSFAVSWNNGSPLYTPYPRPAYRVWPGDATAKHGLYFRVDLGTASANIRSGTTYYIRLQTIDGGLARSGWGTESSVFVAEPGMLSAVGLSSVGTSALTAGWASGFPGGTQYTAQLSTAADFSGTLASSTTLNLAASFSALSANTSYYARVSTGLSGPFTALGSTVTLIESPTAVFFDEVSSHSLVAWAHAAGAGALRSDAGQSGVNIARDGAYAGWKSDAWAWLPPMSTGRNNSGLCAYAGRLYAYGGHDGTTYISSAEAYDPSSGAWSALAAMPATRADFASARVGGTIYVVGGASGGPVLTTNYAYDIAANAWSSKTAMPTARSYAGAVELNGRVHVLGGWSGSNLMSANEAFDPAAGAWATGTAVPTAWGIGAAAALGGKVYLVAGSTASGVPSTLHAAFDAGLGSWSSPTVLPSPARYAGRSAAVGGKIYVVGGRDPVAASVLVEEYDPAVDAWARYSSLAPARTAFGLAVLNGQLYGAGGGTDVAVTSTAWSFDMARARHFSGLQPNTQYSFKAKARNRAGVETGESSAFSTYTWAAVPSTAAPAFIGVFATSVAVQWLANGNPGGTEFRVHLSTASDFNSGASSQTGSWQTSLVSTMTSLSALTTWYFRVQARNSVGVETAYGVLGSTRTTAYPAPPGCALSLDVAKAGAPFTTLTAALAAVPASLSAETCVVIRDSATYQEQVTVANKATNGYRLRILGDTALSSPPTVDPPAASTAAFQVKATSVSIETLRIAPSAAVNWGIAVTSGYVTVSRVLVESSTQVVVAAIDMESYGRVEFSTVAVGVGRAVYFNGASAHHNTLYRSTFSNASAANHTLWLSGPDNTILESSAHNTSGVAVMLGAVNSVMDRSTATAGAIGNYAASISAGSSSTTIARSFLRSSVGRGLSMGGSYHSVVESTITTTGTAEYGLAMAGVTHSTVSRAYIYSATGIAATLIAGANWNRIEDSTVIAGNLSAFVAQSSSFNTVSGSVLRSVIGSALSLTDLSDGNLVQGSTLAAYGTGGGASIDASSSNSITSCYIYSSSGTAMALSNGANANTIQQSTLLSDAPAAYALYMTTAASNSIVLNMIINTTGYAAFLGANANGNLIDRSTVTARSAGFSALYLDNASTNTISRSYLYSLAGNAVTFGFAASSNTLSKSTAAASGPTSKAFYLYSAPDTWVSDSWLLGGGYGVYAEFGQRALIARSTVTGSGSVPAFMVAGSSGISLRDSYVAGPDALDIFTGTGTLAERTAFHATGGSGRAVQLRGGSVGITLASTTLNALAVGLLVDATANGPLSIASMTVTASTGVQFQGGTHVATITAMEFLAAVSVNIDGSLLGAGSRITMRDYRGSKSGPGFENDPSGRVDWMYPPTISSGQFTGVFGTSVSVNWASGFPSETPYTAQLSTASDFSGTLTSSATLNLSAAFSGLSANTSYYARVSTVPSGPYTALGSTITLIQAPTAIVFDEISTTTLVVAAYSPTPAFTNLGAGLSGTNIAKDGVYAGWHGEAWTAKTAMASARYGLSAAAAGGRIYALGGWGVSALSTNAEYDPQANAWTAKAAMPSASNALGAVSLGGKIFAVGGEDSGGLLSVHQRYDPQTNSWSSAAALPSARTGVGAAVLGGKIYSLGGLGGSGYITAVDAYDPATDSWGSRGPLARINHAMAAAEVGGRLYSLAGYDGVTLSSGTRYDPGLDSWSAVSSAPFAVSYPAFAAIGGKIYLFGGSATAGPIGVTQEYDPSADAWALRTSLPTTRGRAAGAVIAGRAYVVGGVNGPALAANEEFDPGTARQFTGLSPNTQYTFTAKARNAAGTETGTVTASTYTAAAVPTGSAIAMVGGSSLTLSWGANGNPAGTEFQASVSTMGAFPSEAVGDWTAGATSATFTGLLASATYYARVRARNAVGVTTDYDAIQSTRTGVLTAWSLSSAPVSGVSVTGLALNWGSSFPVGTQYAAQVATAADFSGTLTSSATLNLSAAFSGLSANTSYYARVSTVPSGPYTALGSTITLIQAPTAIVFDEISTTTLVVAAYSPTPAFTNLGAGLSGTNIAKDGVYAGWHGEAWTVKAPLPAARYALAAAAANGRLYALGGWTTASVTANTEYDPFTDAWTTKAPLPAAANALAAVALGGAVYAVGGENSGGLLSGNRRYDPGANAWTSLQPLPSSRTGMGLAVLGRSLVGLGGLGASGYIAAVSAFDADAGAWSARASLPGINHAMAAAEVGGRLYSLAGYDGVTLSSGMRYDPGLDSWSTVSGAPFAVSYPAFAAIGGKIYLFGGSATAGPIGVTQEYDPSADAWTLRTGLPTARGRAAGAVIAGRAYVVGGTNGATLATHESYDPGTARQFTGLSPNTQYTFTAKARNAAGTETGTVTASTYTAAAVPTGIAFTMVSPSSLTFSWGSGGNPSGTQFQAAVSTLAGFGAETAGAWSADAFSASFAGLTPEATYYARVRARNAVGTATEYAASASTWTSEGPATRYWDGGGTSINASEAANWVGDRVPRSGDSVVFSTPLVKFTFFDLPLSLSSLTLSGSYGGPAVVATTGLVVGTVQLTTGVFQISNATVTVTGDVLMSGYGRFQWGNGRVRVGGNMRIDSPYCCAYSAGDMLEFYGSSYQVVTGTGRPQLPHVEVTNSSGAAFVHGATVEAHSFSLLAGTFTLGGAGNLRIGAWTQTGGYFNAQASTVTFMQMSAPNRASVAPLAGNPFKNLEVGFGTNGIAYLRALGPLELNGGVTITTGAFDGGAFTHRVRGDWLEPGGPAQFPAGTLRLTGTGEQRLRFSPFTALNALEAASQSSVTVQAGSTLTVAALSLGAPGLTPRLRLRSSTAGSPWYLVVTGTAAVSRAQVSDSDASGGIPIRAASGDSVNSGGNRNWDFGGAAPGAPGAPSGAALGASSVSWTWAAVAGAEGYQARVPATGALLAAPSAPAFVQTGLSPNSAVGLAVAAVAETRAGALSAAATVYTPALPPAGTAAAVSATSATLSWGLNGNPAGTLAEVQRSSDSASYASVFTGTTAVHADAGLQGCSTYYYRVRNRGLGGAFTAFDAVVSFVTLPSTPLGAGELSAESLPGSVIRLSWVSSPDPGLTGYRLYYDSGTGTVDYAAPLAALGASATSYTTGALANGVVYKFGLRALNRCGREEAGPGAVTAAPALGSLSGVRAAIKVPASGKRISGNRVLVMAELVSGEPERTRQVLFQYRASSGAAWTAIPAANLQHANPDADHPYFVHWDVTGLAPAEYDLRAVATDVFSNSDPSPGLVSVSVDPVNFEVRETDQGGGRVKKEQTVNNAVSNTIAAAESGSAVVTKVLIPAGAVSASTTVVTVQVNPAGAPSHAADVVSIGATLEVNLGSGQSLLAGGQTAALVFNYPDSDGDGVVDGTTLRAANLSIVTYDAPSGKWKKEFSASVDETARTVTGHTPHFSFFSLIGAVAANLSSVTVYPNPYKPSGGNPDEGRAFSRGDPLSGILFDNLPASVRITIYTLTGSEVASFGTDSGTGTVQWDARNSSGEDVASGGYFAVIKSPGAEPVVVKIGVIR